MAKSAEVAVLVAAAVAAVCLVVGSTAFTSGLQVTSPPAGAPRQFLGRTGAPEEAGVGSTAAPLAFGAAVGLAGAALAAASRGLVARQWNWQNRELALGQKKKSKEALTVFDPDMPVDSRPEAAPITYPNGYWPKGTGPYKRIPGAPSLVTQKFGTDAFIGADNTIGFEERPFGTASGWGPVGIYTPQAVFAGGLAGAEYTGFGPGDQFSPWDPAGLSSRYPEHLPWYREAELKHGRVAMLACIGLVAPDAFRIPIDICNDGSLDMLTAHNKLIGPGLGQGPMWWLLLFCGTIESIRFKQLGLGFGDLTLENAGDWNFGKGFLPTSKVAETQMRVKELKNGRLAMLAFGGAMTQGIAWEVHHFPFVPTS